MTMAPYRLPEASAVYGALEHVAQYGILGHHDPRIFDVGTSDYVAHFEREVLEFVARGGATCRFFEGSYGAGKTHLLRLLAASAAARGMATVRTDLSQELGLDNWQPITRTILDRIEVDLGHGPVRGLPHILDGLRQAGRADTTALKAAMLPHAGFKAAMLRAATIASRPDALRRYLLGERVSAAELKREGIAGVKDPLSRRNAEQVLATVLGGLFRLGLPGTVVLFDENERTLNSTRATFPTKLITAANLMRRVIDSCTTGGLVGTAIVFAVLPGFLDNCALKYPALGQRLALPRGAVVTPAWRWPVLPLDAVTPDQEHEDFLDAAVERFSALMAHCGAAEEGLDEFADELYACGATVLGEQAGQGYRRPLMKQLASLVLDRLGGEVGA